MILPVLKQLRQAGYDGPVFHSSGVNPNQAEQILGSDFNTIMQDNYDCAGTLPTTSANPATQEFAAAYQERFEEYPQDLTMWAYDFPFIVAAAMVAGRQHHRSGGDHRRAARDHRARRHGQRLDSGEGGRLFTDRDGPHAVGDHDVVPGATDAGERDDLRLPGRRRRRPGVRRRPCAAL